MIEGADRFKEANAISPVVSAKVIGNGGKGALYKLANDTLFKLTSEECRQVTPRWAL